MSRTGIVVATRDRHAELLRTLGELRRAAPEAPITVVDNASSDGTPEAVAAAHPDVRVLALPRNLGAVARNLGVLCARTRYVAFSDDDSWWAPGALGIAERCLDRHPRVGLLAARTLVGPHQRPDPVDELMAGSPLGTEDGLPGPSVLGFTACSAVVRREAFLDAGGFSGVLSFVAEEKLLAQDLAARGWELIYLSELVAHHHPSQFRPAGRSRAAQERRNNALIDWMRRPPAVIAERTRALLRDALRDPAARRAALGAARRLPAALRERAPLDERTEQRVRLIEESA